MDFLEKLLPFVGGTGGALALALVWYLKARDSKDSVASTASQSDCREVHQAVIELARLHGRQTEILEQQTELIQRCADRHEEHRVTMARVEAKVDGMRGGVRN